MMVGAGREVAGKEERAVDITDISDKQTEIDNDIKNKWGNPSTSQLTQFSGGNISASSGDYWYYLNSDVSASYSRDIHNLFGNVRIVLNGYSISGYLQIRSTSYDGVALSVFDKIPGKSGTGYDYNPNPVKYYKYNSSTGAYTDYSTSVPSGTNVTDMPTFKNNTYIKVTGSAISPNSRNSNIMTLLIGTEHGVFNMYGINVVGCTPYLGIMIYVNGSKRSSIYQCTVIGNLPDGPGGAVGISSTQSIMQGCKVYGNKSTNSSYGLQPSDTNLLDRMHDVGYSSGSVLYMYKCNIGSMINRDYTNSVYVKDVNFGNETVTIATDTIPTFFESLNDISGTIELVYNCTTTYAGNSPNLNFIVHGNDSDTAPKKGKNNLTVSGTCGNITTAFDDTTVVKPITINGTCSGVATKGNVTIGSNGSATIPTGKSVGGTVTNNGSLTLAGSVTNLTNNGDLCIPQGASCTISGAQTLGGNVANQGTLTIDSGVTVTNPIDNTGTLNVTGTVSDVYGYGSINVNANGNVTIPAGKEAGTISNQGGTLTVAGSANNANYYCCLTIFMLVIIIA